MIKIIQKFLEENTYKKHKIYKRTIVDKEFYYTKKFVNGIAHFEFCFFNEEDRSYIVPRLKEMYSECSLDGCSLYKGVPLKAFCLDSENCFKDIALKSNVCSHGKWDYDNQFGKEKVGNYA